LEAGEVRDRIAAYAGRGDLRTGGIIVILPTPEVTTMPDFLLRDLPEDLMTALRQRAGLNSRSLQAEIRETLAESVPMPWEEWLTEVAALQVHMKPGGTPAAELIRQGREERDAAIDRALRGDYPEDLMRP
jgi:plasmid stability protein